MMLSKCFPEDAPNATNKIVENNENQRKKNYSRYFEIRGSGEKRRNGQKPARDAVSTHNRHLKVIENKIICLVSAFEPWNLLF